MVRETVEQIETGYRLTIKSTRGTGTRDQDEVRATAKTETLEELEDQRVTLRQAVLREMGVLRGFQPDGEGDA